MLVIADVIIGKIITVHIISITELFFASTFAKGILQYKAATRRKCAGYAGAK